jgi:hypothetical protein
VSREQKVRAFLFYLSVAVFLMGLPLILYSSFGYKFSRRTLRFTKAGIIDLKTQPAGARVYLDGQLLKDPTPLTIDELLPGPYVVRLELEKHYPWVAEVMVEAGKVARLDKTILFPLRPDIQQVNQERVSFFSIEHDTVYCIDEENRTVYASDLEGGHFKRIGQFLEMSSRVRGCKVSPDKEKMLIYSARQIAPLDLQAHREGRWAPDFLLDLPDFQLLDVFWHSDSFHLILVTNRSIDVIEARPKALPLNLITLNKRDPNPFYDKATDTLYFTDSQMAADGRFYDNVYKLDLRPAFSPFKEFLKPKADER